ncbi:hypothetical protein BKA81DRAFT_235510 [Phyllosticta paracitricarpa]
MTAGRRAKSRYGHMPCSRPGRLATFGKSSPSGSSPAPRTRAGPSESTHLTNDGLPTRSSHVDAPPLSLSPQSLHAIYEPSIRAVAYRRCRRMETTITFKLGGKRNSVYVRGRDIHGTWGGTSAAWSRPETASMYVLDVKTLAQGKRALVDDVLWSQGSMAPAKRGVARRGVDAM